MAARRKDLSAEGTQEDAGVFEGHGDTEYLLQRTVSELHQ